MLWTRLVLLLLLSALHSASTAQTRFLSGTVLWATESPAVGLQMDLLDQSGNSRARVYTNPAGRFAFYGISGHPRDYSLRVSHQSQVLHTSALSNFGIGARLPPIAVER